MRIGFFGDGPWASLAIEQLVADGGFDLAFIAPRCHEPDADLKAHAERLGIPFKTRDNINHPDFVSWVVEQNPDINVSMSFNQIFREPVICSAPAGLINCHAGALPFYRGRNVINWAIINGEDKIGVTVHYVDSGIDTGDIILQDFIPVSQRDDYGTVLALAHQQCADTLVEALKIIRSGNTKRTRQEPIHPIGTYCPGRVAGDEWINWQWPTEQIHNFIRGVAPPAPGAQTSVNGVRIAVIRSELIADAPSYIATSGVVVGRDPGSVVIKTGDTTVRITQIADIDGSGGIKNLRAPNFRIGTRLETGSQRNRDNAEKPVIVIGAGGHAKVVIEALRQLGRKIIGLTESPDYLEDTGPFGVRIIGDDSSLSEYAPDTVRLVNGIGSLPGSNTRWDAFVHFSGKGHRFASVYHPESYIAEDTILGEGCQVMARAVIQPGTRIGRQSIINTSSSIDHDCLLGDNVHVAPGATLCGSVVVGDNVYIGAGATIIQSLSIGENAVVGAGAVVVKDVCAGQVVMSTPASSSRSGS
jgi:methionyl-tRNA formyltransferase